MHPQLSAGDLCTRHVVFARRDTALVGAARLMREQHVGCLVVVDEGSGARRPIGMLTDRDIVTAVVAPGVDPALLSAGDVMSEPPAVVRAADSLRDALAAMRHAGARRVPVVDERGALHGLLALDDVFEALAQQMSMMKQVLDGARERELGRRA